MRPGEPAGPGEHRDPLSFLRLNLFRHWTDQTVVRSLTSPNGENLLYGATGGGGNCYLFLRNSESFFMRLRHVGYHAASEGYNNVLVEHIL